MGSTGPGDERRAEQFGSRLAEAAAEVLVKAGLQALIASGLLAAAFLGSLALVMRDLPKVLAAATSLFLFVFVAAMVYIAVLRRRHQRLLAQLAVAAVQARVQGLETLLQQLRAVDLEMTALRCHGRTDPEQSPEEGRRDCARVVLRPIYNQLLSAKRGRVSVAFHVWDEARQHFRHVVATPEFRPAERDGVAQLGRDSAAGRALAEGEPNIIADVATPEARQRGWRPLPLHRTSGSSIQVPVYRIGGRVDGEWLGVISADSETTGVFGASDGNLMLEFATKLNLIYEAMFEPDRVDTTTSTP